MNKKKLAHIALYSVLGALAIYLVCRDAGLATALKAVLAVVAYCGVVMIARDGYATIVRVRGSVELPAGLAEPIRTMAEERLKASMLDVLTDKGVAETRVWTEDNKLMIETEVGYIDRDGEADDDDNHDAV